MGMPLGRCASMRSTGPRAPHLPLVLTIHNLIDFVNDYVRIRAYYISVESTKGITMWHRTEKDYIISKGLLFQKKKNDKPKIRKGFLTVLIFFIVWTLWLTSY